ncbi:hypothetical protein B0J11DRAFT_569905 [Dendryphion nanum]|uniref:Uncharacterized protein n=1 Tax=Dendryphion nanum TaxID=256645 RepID=A0A9P9DL59_9PLEO|nr:hypothetical protein B0J11DRAFT_569905 [Dendryphion nanum]
MAESSSTQADSHTGSATGGPSAGNQGHGQGTGRNLPLHGVNFEIARLLKPGEAEFLYRSAKTVQFYLSSITYHIMKSGLRSDSYVTAMNFGNKDFDAMNFDSDVVSDELKKTLAAISITHSYLPMWETLAYNIGPAFIGLSRAPLGRRFPSIQGYADDGQYIRFDMRDFRNLVAHSSGKLEFFDQHAHADYRRNSFPARAFWYFFREQREKLSHEISDMINMLLNQVDNVTDPLPERQVSPWDGPTAVIGDELSMEEIIERDQLSSESLTRLTLQYQSARRVHDSMDRKQEMLLYIHSDLRARQGHMLGIEEQYKVLRDQEVKILQKEQKDARARASPPVVPGEWALPQPGEDPIPEEETAPAEAEVIRKAIPETAYTTEVISLEKGPAWGHVADDFFDSGCKALNDHILRYLKCLAWTELASAAVNNSLRFFVPPQGPNPSPE